LTLSKTQLQALSKVRAAGNSEIDSSLDDATCCYLLSVLVRDLALAKLFPELPPNVPDLFSEIPPVELRVPDRDFIELYARALENIPDADAYFLCLAKLQKARIKYSKILQKQPMPTVEQVGPRALLQLGQMSVGALVTLLFWRKWMFDIDNRAGQETGYLFEPIISYCIGGVSYGATNSPIRRLGSRQGGGRQVDCLVETKKAAYEVKIRVTIAASGQGRWAEELSFPTEAAASGYKPILVVLDPTSNPKLLELADAFVEAKGEVYLGLAAWAHLEEAAGPVMSTFLDKHVKDALGIVLGASHEAIKPIAIHLEAGHLIFTLGDEVVDILRDESPMLASGSDEIPADTVSGPPTP